MRFTLFARTSASVLVHSSIPCLSPQTVSIMTQLCFIMLVRSRVPRIVFLLATEDNFALQ